MSLATRRCVPGLARAILPVLAISVAAGAASTADVESLLAKGKVDEAIEAGRRAVETNPKDPELRVALARALARKARRVERTVEVAGGDRAVRIDPGREPGTPRVVYDASGLEEALEHVRAAIELAPERKQSRFSECYLLTDAGHVERAAAAIRETADALEGEPGLAESLASYGSERIRRGDVQGGRILLGVVASRFPDDARVQVSYGTALARDGKQEEAIAALDKAAELAPGDLEIQRRRAVVYVLLRDFRRATRSFQAAFLLSREEPDRLGAAAATFAYDPERARYLLQELAAPAASADPAVVAAADKFLRAASRFREPRLELVRMLLRNGQPVLAIPVLDGLRQANPKDRETLRLMRAVYDRLEFPLPEDGRNEP